MDNLIMVTHHWPGITPMNIWDMRYGMWLIYVAAVKELKDKEVRW